MNTTPEINWTNLEASIAECFRGETGAHVVHLNADGTFSAGCRGTLYAEDCLEVWSLDAEPVEEYQDKEGNRYLTEEQLDIYAGNVADKVIECRGDLEGWLEAKQD